MERDERKRAQVKTIKIGNQTVHVQAPPLKLSTKEINILSGNLTADFKLAMAANDKRRAKDVINLAEKLCLPGKVLLEIRNEYFAEYKN